jgi:hypothetical protein
MRLKPNGVHQCVSSWRFGVVGACVLCSVVVLHVISVLYARAAQPPKDPAYDLSRCTRIEIRLDPSTLAYLGLDDEEKVLLTQEEQEHLKSLTTIVCENKESIYSFAMVDLVPGRYVGPAKGEPRISNKVHIVGYDTGERVTALTMIGNTIRTEDRQEFEYRWGFPHRHLILAQVWPFVLRSACADNLARLRGSLVRMVENQAYSPPTKWCDAVLRGRQEFITERSYEKSDFECPSAHTCHYAINPDCKPDSSEDTVLLFETKAGWNQHGGPELFTFDNHDPRGGCVLLNDGTVKFIRSEVELRQLRWK